MKSRISRKSRKSRLDFQQLEARELKAADISFGADYVAIDGASFGDYASVNPNGNKFVVTVNGYSTGKLDPTVYKTIYFNGNGGNDTFINNTSIKSVAQGNHGNDRLWGGTARDEFFGGPGEDNLDGRFGSDLLRGGEGHDIISGGWGADTIFGDTGNDDINGGRHADVIRGGPGRDSIKGEHGYDTIYGDNGDDVIYGGTEADSLIGGNGNDFIDAGSGNYNYVAGGKGNDQLYGGNQIDVIYGSYDSDTIHGNGGNDTLYGGTGNDKIYGQSGDDVISGGYGNDFVTGQDGNDAVYGDAGNDEVYGYNGNDFVFGGPGNDWLYGGFGNDTIYGHNGNDNLYGSAGADQLFGGNGNDGLFGGFEAGDNLTAGAGKDRFLYVAAGNVWKGTLHDPSTEDAVVKFVSLGATTVDLGAGVGPTQFAAGNWSEVEIRTIDKALANVHGRTGNTSLLKTYDGWNLTFQRVGRQLNNLHFQVGGWNTNNGTIAFTELSMVDETNLLRTTYHELGHNWDNSYENAYVQNFYAISRWRIGYQAGFTASSATGDNWYYQDAATDFARYYGTWNPFEDYATTWETYFMYYYHNNAGQDNLVGSKFANLDAFFASI